MITENALTSEHPAYYLTSCDQLVISETYGAVSERQRTVNVNVFSKKNPKCQLGKSMRLVPKSMSIRIDFSQIEL